MRDYFSLGPTPSEEDCAQVGQPDYRRKALTECARFIDLIRTTLGPEPAGAELAIKSFPHDFGTYYEVVVWFERDDAAAIAYAVRCEDDAPRTWEGGRHIMTHKAILVHCGHCGHTWPAEALDQIHDYWSRVEPGAVVPLGQCPDVDCGALCYPTYGYVFELEQRLSTTQNILTRLLTWAESVGGREAAVWNEACRLLTPSDMTEPNAPKEIR